jgi:hypothetical protein
VPILNSKKLSDIRVGKRHRQDVGDIRTLAASIERLGLLHPVVVVPIMVLMVGLIGREYIQLERFNMQCSLLLRRHMCPPPSPDAFTRFAIYCFIGMLETALLFALSLRVESCRQRREFEGAWKDLKY